MSSIFLLGHLQKNQLEPKAKSVEDPLYIASNSHFYHLALILKASRVFFPTKSVFSISTIQFQHAIHSCGRCLFARAVKYNFYVNINPRTTNICSPNLSGGILTAFFKKNYKRYFYNLLGHLTQIIANNDIGILRHVCQLSVCVPLKNIISTLQYCQCYKAVQLFNIKFVNSNLKEQKSELLCKTVSDNGV